MATLVARVVLLTVMTLAKAQHGELNLTLRSQHMSAIGRQEWLVQNQGVSWTAASTAFVIVDMWDKHWCPSATTRVAELATPMNQFVKAARLLGAHIVWAPSDVTGFYPPTNCTARNNTLSLEHYPLPPTRNVTIPQFPLSSATDGGCDIQAPIYGESLGRQSTRLPFLVPCNRSGPEATGHRQQGGQ